MLPNPLDYESYWNQVYAQPMSFWQAALEVIAQRHLNGSGGWQRARLGRNVVFFNHRYVLKLGPPCWRGEMGREAFALTWIEGKLPVRTPEVVAAGVLDGWEYLVQRRMAGRNLLDLWKDLSAPQREALAAQHGELLQALHGLPAAALEADHPLYFDWEAMLAWQRRECAAAMRTAGFHPELVEQVNAYLDEAAPLLDAPAQMVLLHGDLTHLNLLVQPQGADWQITALIDWGDVKIGPPGHEFISPAVHMYRGSRAAIAAFYRGCGDYAYPLRYRQEVMARAMLYYSGELLELFQSIRAANFCKNWDCLAKIIF